MKGFQMPEGAKISSSAKLFLQDEEGNFLLLLRSESSKRFKHIWDLPGGKVDPGESLETALRRELTEETNLACGELSTLGNRTFNLEEISCTETLYSADLVGQSDIRLSDEHEEHRWVTLESLESEEFQLLPHMADFVRNCKELHNDGH
jgi:8-oxo-dGTP diphosphatase